VPFTMHKVPKERVFSVTLGKTGRQEGRITRRNEVVQFLQFFLTIMTTYVYSLTKSSARRTGSMKLLVAPKIIHSIRR
jgi:hypothetical protein